MRLRNTAFFLFLVLGIPSAIAQVEVTLEQAVALALEKNYDVRIARNISEAAATDDNWAVTGFLPRVNVDAASVWTDNEQALRFLDATRNNSGEAKANNISASVQATWTLFDGTRMFATRERISEVAEQSELLVKEQMINTIAQVITSYYDIVRQKQQLKAIQEQMLVSEERVKLAEKKLEVGTGIRPELLQAKVDYNAQKTQVLQQETMIAQLKEELNNMVGLSLPEGYDVADTIIIDLNLRMDESFQNLDNTNYSLMASRRNVNIASLSLRERRAEYFPSIDFSVARTFSRNDNARQINPFGPVYNRTEGWNYGFTLSFPILGGFNTPRLTQLAKIELDRQQLLFEQQRNTTNVELRNAFTNYDNARKILLIEEENIGLARENLFIALESFKRGVNTFIELRTAQQSLAEAYNRLISARYNAKVAETELLRLNGSLLK